MKNPAKILLMGCFLTLCNYGFSQCHCVDNRIIELKDTVTTQGYAAFTFKMTSDSSNCSSGYTDFWFVDQIGDTINEWTGSGMWMPNPADPMFDTTEYIIQLKPGYPSFPADFSGNLQVWNPDCTIPFTLATLTTNELTDSNLNIQFFPNPTGDHISVLNTSPFPMTSLEVYAANGSLVLSEPLHTDFISVKKLNPGIYFVKLYSDEKVLAVKKMVKD